MARDVDVFAQLPPFEQIDGFLGQPLVDRLLACVEERSSDFVLAGLGSGPKGQVNLAVRNASMLQGLGDFRAELESRFIAVLDHAVRGLRLSPINLFDLELQLVAHGDGAFYSEHIDTFTARADLSTDRALTGVYYFHRHPKAFEGGDLRLHAITSAANGKRRHIDIAPVSDRLVLFPAWVPHEVRQIRCPSGAFLDSRFAINCWYRTRRPEAQAQE